MLLRIGSMFILACLLLSACGTPDAGTAERANASTSTALPELAAASPAPIISHDIAKLLRKRPAPGEQIEIDVYNWVGGYRMAGYGSDERHCPDLANESLLTDQPVVGMLSFPHAGIGNAPLTYPPDSEPWLVPTFAALKILAYPPPDEQAANPRELGYRLRVRGHLDDPYFSHCTYPERIFVIDRIITIYTQSDPNLASPFEVSLPADFAQWQRFSAPGQRLHFPQRAGWAVAAKADPTARAALEVQMPEWPEHPISIRALNAPPVRAPRDGAQGDALLDLAFLRQRLKLPANGQAFTGEVLIDTVDAYTKTCTVLLTQGDATYELKVSYPVGLHADRELLLAFTALVAGFEVEP